MLVYLATYAEMPQGDTDDQQLIPELESLGISARFVVWDDPAVDWSKAELTIIRNTWDYFLKYPAFLRWLDDISTKTQLMNPVDIIRWNLHKGYQQELSQKGVHCVETVWINKNTPVSIANVIEQHGWNRFVIKPAISAASYATRRFSVDELSRAQHHINTFNTQADLMIQPYLEAFDSQGETSLIFFDGVFSHAVQRQAALNASNPLAAHNESATVPCSAITYAQTVLNLIDAKLLYARVDLSINDDNHHTLLELELIEPSLFLAYHPDAARRFAIAIANRLR